MRKTELIDWLRRNVPPSLWERLWWQTPLLMLLLLPAGALILQMLGWLGWYGAPFALQGLMLASVFGGVLVGLFILWCVGATGLPPHLVRRAQLLAPLSIVGPFLTLVLMGWVANLH